MTKIALGDGRFCYAGPTCKLHSARGIQTAKNALVAADTLFTQARTLEDMTEAKHQLEEASKLYDATDDGQNVLRSVIDSESADPLTRAQARQRLTAAQELAAELDKPKDKDAIQDLKPLPPLPAAFGKKFNVQSVEGGGYGGNAWVGSNAGERRDTAEVAKALRADFKDAQKRGWLPKEATFSVTIDRYSGGSSVRVDVRGFTDASTLEKDPHSRWEDDMRTTGNAKELLRRVQVMADSYNSRDDNGGIDYFSGHHYSNVQLETENSRNFRIREAARLKANREHQAVKKNWLATVKQDRQQALSNLTPVADFTDPSTMSSSAFASGKVARVAGTNIFVVTSADGQISQGYDLSSYTSGDGTDADELARDYLTNWRSRARIPKNRKFVV